MKLWEKKNSNERTAREVGEFGHRELNITNTERRLRCGGVKMCFGDWQ